MPTPTLVSTPPAAGLIVAEELAELWSVTTDTVYAWARAGRIDGAVKLGRNWRFRRDACYKNPGTYADRRTAGVPVKSQQSSDGSWASFAASVRRQARARAA